MTPQALERYLHQHIPLSLAMETRVLEVSPQAVQLQAPLAPNINHRETVFGGSASAVAILAAWSLLHVRLRADGLPSRVVIQRNTMEYLQPIEDTFSARAGLHDDADWARFSRLLQRKGKARITVDSALHCGDRCVGRLSGDFVAFTRG